jgi:hypothetical protein
LIVHACHCKDCQRISGSAFVVNIWIEEEFVRLRSGHLKSFALKGGSGKDHEVFFCEACGTHAWSRYDAAPGKTLFVRAGTLDSPRIVQPDVHIFVKAKLPWVQLPSNVPAFEGFYSIKDIWPTDRLARLRRSMSEQHQ